MCRREDASSNLFYSLVILYTVNRITSASISLSCSASFFKPPLYLRVLNHLRNRPVFSSLYFKVHQTAAVNITEQLLSNTRINISAFTKETRKQKSSHHIIWCVFRLISLLHSDWPVLISTLMHNYDFTVASFLNVLLG